jgi:predicted metalloendopeptidase
MMVAIEEAFGARLRRLTWMDEQTRTHALAKLARVSNKIAYPEQFDPHTGLTLPRTPCLAWPRGRALWLREGVRDDRQAR